MSATRATAAIAVAAFIELALQPVLTAGPATPAVRAPEIVSDTWINSAPQTIAGLKGRVVLIEFWTFACQNCRNVEPYVKLWDERYAEKGLTVIGVCVPWPEPRFPASDCSIASTICAV